MITVGIDPGCTGALVALHRGEPVEWLLMPTLKVGTNTRVNAAAVASWLRGLNNVDDVFLEQVGPGKAQGAASMFTFGHAAGVVQGAVVGLGLPLTLVTPQAWKKRAGLIGTDKDAARSRAILLWPKWRELDAKGNGQALADAALIAKVYGAAA